MDPQRKLPDEERPSPECHASRRHLVIRKGDE